MKALKFAGRKIEIVSIPPMDIRDETKALQNIIGGYIETVRLADDAVMLVDEDGYCKCLPPNLAASAFAGQVILGTASGQKKTPDREPRYRRTRKNTPPFYQKGRDLSSEYHRIESWNP